MVFQQINKATQNQQSIANGDLDSLVMNPNDWETQKLTTNDDYEYYIKIYDVEMGYISSYNRIRKEYVSGKISKQEFLEESKTIKNGLNNFSM